MNDVTSTERDALEDELLAVRCQLGDAAALDSLIERWHQPLWRYLHRMRGDEEDAAELLQDVWLRVLRSLPRLRDPARLRPWLFGIARRALMDRLRREYAAPAASEELDLEDPAVPEDERDVDEELHVMRDELRQMPLVEREVLVLFYLRELTLAEVADVLDVPVGTVKSRLFRARSVLRDRLERKGIQP